MVKDIASQGVLVASNVYNAQLAFARELPRDLIQALLFTLTYALLRLSVYDTITLIFAHAYLCGYVMQYVIEMYCKGLTYHISQMCICHWTHTCKSYIMCLKRYISHITRGKMICICPMGNYQLFLI